MKYNVLLFLLISSILLLSGNVVVANVGHDDEASLIKENGVTRTADECDTPTESLTIKSPSDLTYSYDQEEYELPKNTCVALTFINISPIEHDMEISETTTDDFDFEKVMVHIINNTAGLKNDGSGTVNFMTPDADYTLDIVCTLQGHAEAGMVAKLKIGKGTTGNTLVVSGIIAFIIAISAIVYIKKIKV